MGADSAPVSQQSIMLKARNKLTPAHFPSWRRVLACRKLLRMALFLALLREFLCCGIPRDRRPLRRGPRRALGMPAVAVMHYVASAQVMDGEFAAAWHNTIERARGFNYDHACHGKNNKSQ